MTAQVHICQVFSSFEAGGMELGAVKVMNGLGPRYRYTVLALDGSYGAATHLSPSLQITCAEPPRSVGARRTLAVRSFLRELQPDLIVTHNWGSVYALIGAALARVSPIVHQEHGYGRDGATAPTWKQMITYRLLLRTVDLLVVPSRTLETVARRAYGVPAGRLRRLSNGVDTARFTPHRDRSWRRWHGVPDDALLFGWVARLREEKNLPLLLRALAQANIANAWLAVVGDGPCRDDCQRLAGELGIGERVIFAGQVDDPGPIYAACDAFTMSSTTEQMPNVLLEAMACGLPALCTDVGESRAMLGDDRWIVPPGDTAAYARTLAALATCIEVPEQGRALGAANRARCEEQFPLQGMVEGYRDTFEGVLNRRTRR